MSTPYFFSHDEDGFNFFGDVYSLIRETPRLEDCYVYVGEAELLGPESDQVEYEEWQEYREDSMNALDWIQYEGNYQHNLLKKENEKLKQQLEIANEYCEQWGYHWDEEEEVYRNEEDEE